jgi:TM2 domain-containing membrane protein YozV
MKFCSNCGSKVEQGQAVCLSCGFSLKPSSHVSSGGWFDAASHNGHKRGVIAIITWFLGVFGVHRFMLDDNKSGGLMLLLLILSFLVVPAIILLIWVIADFYKVITATNEEFEELFKPKS